MSEPEPPLRFRRALAALGEVSGLSVLEIGCGPGVAIQALLETAAPARLRGLDRSATAVARARTRNAAALQQGRVDFVEGAFESAGKATWDRVFAINVNAFWKDPDRSFPRLAGLLAPEGRFLLVWEAPGAMRAREIAARLERVDAPGLRIDPVQVEGRLVCLKGGPRRSRPA